MRSNSHLRTLLVACFALVVALSLVSSATAKQKIHLTAAGHAAARAVVVKRVDLGNVGGWTGGAQKPDLSSEVACANFHEKESDLVLNGAAKTVWKHTGLEFTSESEVLQTSRMVRLDWQRTVLSPQLLPCLRSQTKKQESPGVRLISLRRIGIPQIAPYAAAYRIVMDVKVSGATVRMMSDMVLVGRGRTEITLTTVAALGAKSAVWPAEIRLARILVSRIRA
ncbi:MAG: hypothetical protein ABSC51_05685 [Gaiellaceae bacterium]|jgi:hypothetical protein